MVSGWCKGKALVCHHCDPGLILGLRHVNNICGEPIEQGSRYLAYKFSPRCAMNTYSTSRELVPLACKDGVDYPIYLGANLTVFSAFGTLCTNENWHDITTNDT